MSVFDRASEAETQLTGLDEGRKTGFQIAKVAVSFFTSEKRLDTDQENIQ